MTEKPPEVPVIPPIYQPEMADEPDNVCEHGVDQSFVDCEDCLDPVERVRAGIVPVDDLVPAPSRLQQLVEACGLDPKYINDSRAAKLASLSPLPLAHRILVARRIPAKLRGFLPVVLSAIAAHFAHLENQQTRVAPFFSGKPWWLNAHVILIAKSGGWKGAAMDLTQNLLGPSEGALPVDVNPVPAAVPAARVSHSVLTYREIGRTTVQGLLGTARLGRGGMTVDVEGAVEKVNDGICFVPELGTLFTISKGQHGGGGIEVLLDWMSKGEISHTLGAGDHRTMSHALLIGAVQPDQADLDHLIVTGWARRVLFFYVPELTREEQIALKSFEVERLDIDETALEIFRAEMRELRHGFHPTSIDLSAPRAWFRSKILSNQAEAAQDVCPIAAALGYHMLTGWRGELDVVVPMTDEVRAMLDDQIEMLNRTMLAPSDSLRDRVQTYLEDHAVMGAGQPRTLKQIQADCTRATGAGKSAIYAVLKDMREADLAFLPFGRGAELDTTLQRFGLPPAVARRGAPTQYYVLRSTYSTEEKLSALKAARKADEELGDLRDLGPEGR